MSKLAKIVFPFDSWEESLGKLLRNYVFPFLLWNLSPNRVLYNHEWEYVLYLLGVHRQNDVSRHISQFDGLFRV